MTVTEATILTVFLKGELKYTKIMRKIRSISAPDPE